MAERGTRVLVTGAAGFIGSALIRQLRQMGCYVTALDSLAWGRRQNLPLDWPEEDLVVCDIIETESLKRVVSERQIQEIYHLAALHYIPDCNKWPCKAIRINVEGTQSMLNAAAHGGVGRVFYASTAGVYSASQQNHKEEDATIPDDIYGLTKLFGEHLVELLNCQTGKPAVIGRLSNVIGPRETNPHLIPHIVNSIRSSDVVPLGNLIPVRDFSYVDDVCRGILAAMQSSSSKTEVTTYNIGSGQGASVQEVLNIIADLTGRTLSVARDQNKIRKSDRSRLVLSYEKLNRDTGWLPEVSLKEGLGQLLEIEGLL